MSTEKEVLQATAAILVGITLLFRVVALRGVSRGNACWYFSLVNLLMALGSLAFLDLDLAADEVHLQVLLVSAIVYCFSAATFLRSTPGIEARTRDFWRMPAVPLTVRQEARIRGIAAVAGVVGLLYFLAVGYNLFVRSIVASVSGTELDFASLRLDSYAGSTYFAPGYVNQFKNMLFPLCILLLGAQRGWRGRSLGALVVPVFAAVLFLAGAGQRGALVLFALIAFLFWELIHHRSAPGSGRVARRSRSVLFGAGVIALFGLVSVFQGRLAGRSAVGGTLSSLWDRLARSNQRSGVEGFRLIRDLDTAYGREWLEASLGILPGHPGSDLSSAVFASLYGGSRGTSPVSLWGSLWHNGAWLGVVLGAVLLALVHVRLYQRMIDGDRTFVRMSLYAAVVALLSTWVAGSHMYLFNNGLPAVLLFYGFVGSSAVLRRQRARRQGHRLATVDSRRLVSPPAQGSAATGP